MSQFVIWPQEDIVSKLLASKCEFLDFNDKGAVMRFLWQKFSILVLLRLETHFLRLALHILRQSSYLHWGWPLEIWRRPLEIWGWPLLLCKFSLNSQLVTPCCLVRQRLTCKEFGLGVPDRKIELWRAVASAQTRPHSSSSQIPALLKSAAD